MFRTKVQLTSRFGERLKNRLVPGRLYIRYRAGKEARQGDAEIHLLRFLVDPARNAIDAGANKGTYTYFLARLAHRVYAYEPNPKMFRLLRCNIAANVEAFPYALGDRTGRATLRVPYGAKGHSNQGASLSETKVVRNFTPIEVETRRIDDLGLRDIGFIKIDVEGHEAAVLAGAAATIARDRPNLLIEIEEKHTQERIERALARILDLGYEGLFVAEGRLQPLSAFDPEAHHRRPRSGYVYNFVFLPKGAGR
jgi:FkbM family methyltransferase